MIILHSEQSKASRDFIALYGNKCEVINWYEDEDTVRAYQMVYPSPNRFPSVFDPITEKLISEPTSWEDLIIQLKDLDEVRILRTRIAEVKAKTKSIIVKGFEITKDEIIYLFPLTETDQLNFTAKVNAYASTDFPLTELETTPTMPITTITEYKAIYRQGMDHVKQTIDEGKQVAMTLLAMDYQQLLDFIDPRD